MSTRDDLGQFFTPQWAADALVERYFGDLTLCDRVVEPSCGPGAFLQAIPDHVPAIGVEIDAALAAQARANTGRTVVVGDFRAVEIPFTPTAIIGNPPFKQALIQGFLDRAWELLPTDGRVGLILPAFSMQTASVVEQMSQRWSLQQDMIPRNLFPRLRLPLCFALLTKDRRRNLVGFALYHEAHAVSRLQQRYRALLAAGEGSRWAAVVRAALEQRGGRATLRELYNEIEGNTPTSNNFWQAKVRQVLQRIAVRKGPGEWALPTPELARAA